MLMKADLYFVNKLNHQILLYYYIIINTLCNGTLAAERCCSACCVTPKLVKIVHQVCEETEM